MREILIFSGGAMFGSLAAFFMFCLVAGIRLKDDGYRKKNDGEGQSDV